MTGTGIYSNISMDKKAEGQERSITMTQTTSYLYTEGLGGDMGTLR